MTHMQKHVDRLIITIKEDNNIAKVSFYLTHLNGTQLAVF